MKNSFLIFLFFSIYVSRIFIIFFHEMGHAISARIITNANVDVYFGSYGTKDKAFKVRFFNMNLYFKKSLFQWKNGLCIVEQPILDPKKQLIFILCGPLGSIPVAIFMIYLGITFAFNEDLLLFLYIFFIVALLDCIYNLIPRNRPILLENGSKTYNDGSKIAYIIKHRQYAKKLFEVQILYEESKFEEAFVLLNDLIFNKNFYNDDILRMTLYISVKINNSEKGVRIYKLLSQRHAITDNDRINVGVLYAQAGDFIKSMECYDTLLTIEPNHNLVLNNKGYTLILAKNYTEAIAVFSKSIEIDPAFCYAYANRAYCKMMLNEFDVALSDLTKAMKLDNTNSYCYSNFGIYYENMGKYDLALEYFKKAKSLDKWTYLIDELIANCEKKNYLISFTPLTNNHFINSFSPSLVLTV